MQNLLTGIAGFIGPYMQKKLTQIGDASASAGNLNSYYNPQLEQGHAEGFLNHWQSTFEQAGCANRLLVSHTNYS